MEKSVANVQRRRKPERLLLEEGKGRPEGSRALRTDGPLSSPEVQGVCVCFSR